MAKKTTSDLQEHMDSIAHLFEKDPEAMKIVRGATVLVSVPGLTEAIGLDENIHDYVKANYDLFMTVLYEAYELRNEVADEGEEDGSWIIAAINSIAHLSGAFVAMTAMRKMSHAQ